MSDTGDSIDPRFEIRHLVGDGYDIHVLRDADAPPISDDQLAADLLAWAAQQKELRLIEDDVEDKEDPS